MCIENFLGEEALREIYGLIRKAEGLPRLSHEFLWDWKPVTFSDPFIFHRVIIFLVCIIYEEPLDPREGGRLFVLPGRRGRDQPDLDLSKQGDHRTVTRITQTERFVHENYTSRHPDECLGSNSNLYPTLLKRVDLQISLPDFRNYLRGAVGKSAKRNFCHG